MTNDTITRGDLLSELLMLRRRVAELEARETLPHTSSEKKTDAEALRESEENYRVVVQMAHEGILVAQDGIHKFVNPALAKLYGQSQEKLLSRPFTEFIHPDDREMVLDRSLRRARGEDLPSRYAHRVVTEDGKIRWLEIDSAAISWGGKPAVLVFTTDITERKRMEEAIKERDEQYQSLVEESFDGIMVTKETKIIFANSRLCQMLGYSKEELVGMDHWLVTHTEYQDLVRQRALARMRGESVSSHYEVKLRRRDGSAFDAEVISRAIEVQGTSGIQVWMKDITARKQAEEALRASEGQLSNAVKMARLGHWEYDVAKDLFTFNDHFYQLFRTTAEQVGDYTMSSAEYAGRFVHPDDRVVVGEEIRKSIETADPHLSQQLEHRILYADGEVGYITVRIFVIKNELGRTVRTYGVNQDITDRKRLESQLLQSQKMEAIGTLTGGIAHDFNNLLTIINGYTEMILMEKTEHDPSYLDLQTILETGRKGAELVQRLLAFTKQRESNPQPTDLSSLVENSVSLIQRTFPKMIEINTILQSDSCMVNVDSVQVEQVLMNLCINAKEAMPNGGRLRVETRNITVDEDYCRLHVEARPGRYVSIEVSDTGKGMDKETMDRVFEPFFTTKGWDSNKGTGLSLPVAKGIVEQHGGWITCQGEPGKGTNFTVYIPAIEEPPVVVKSEPMAETIPSAKKILLVDDEEFVRDLGKRILEQEGYEVITASNGKEALDIYAREQSNIGLVVLDLIMPQMGGEECLEELLRINPLVRAIVSTGHSWDARERLHLELLARGFVNKPYEVRQMVQVVKQVLEPG